jgi:hypothetical protein
MTILIDPYNFFLTRIDKNCLRQSPSTLHENYKIKMYLLLGKVILNPPNYQPFFK